MNHGGIIFFRKLRRHMNINADFFQQFAIFVVFYFLGKVHVSCWDIPLIAERLYVNSRTGSQRSQKDFKRRRSRSFTTLMHWLISLYYMRILT